MTKEVRTVFLCALTYSVIAAGYFIQKGAIIFPFPLNDVLIGIVALLFSFWNRKNLKVSLFVSITGLFFILSNEFIWSVILSQIHLEQIIEKGWLDLFSLLTIILIVIAAILSAFKQKGNFHFLFTILFILFFAIGLIQNNLSYVIAAYGCITLSTQLKKAYHPFDVLWILLFILTFMKWVTLLINNVH